MPRDLRKELKGSFGDPHITCNISLPQGAYDAFLNEVMDSNITVNMMVKFLIMFRYGYIRDLKQDDLDTEISDIEKELDEWTEPSS